MRAASSEPTMRRRGRIARPISSARVSPRPVSALSLARLLLALFVPVREVSATRAFGSPAPVASAPGIIAAEGGRFVDPSDGSTFHVAGANCYYLVYSSGADEGSYEHDWVEEVLETSQQLNLNVLRVWTFQDQWWEKERALQTSPGEYNERFLIALDTLIARASARGIRLLLCLSNYWEDYGASETFFFNSFPTTTTTTATARAPARVLTSTLIPLEPLPPVPPACPSQVARSRTSSGRTRLASARRTARLFAAARTFSRRGCAAPGSRRSFRRC